jgi:hypothetical protein
MTFDTRSSDLGQHARPGSAGRANQALLLLAAGALLINSWRWLSRTHQRRQSSRSQPLPRPLQTWEGEGGRPDPEPETALTAGNPSGADTSASPA